jgi:uncharacterized protein (DUF1501 family)
MFSRRDFLRTGLQTSTLVALAPSVPGFLAQTARAARPERDARVLVVIQLDGGNDGINTVVPFADEGYAKSRKTLRLPADRLFKINKEVGLHPAMGDAAKLLESQRLAIVQGVGYPNPLALALPLHDHLAERQDRSAPLTRDAQGTLERLTKLPAAGANR